EECSEKRRDRADRSRKSVGILGDDIVDQDCGKDSASDDSEGNDTGEAHRKSFLPDSFFEEFRSFPVIETHRRCRRRKKDTIPRPLYIILRSMTTAYWTRRKTRSTSRPMRPVIMYHIILKSLMNDQRGYLNDAGRFFSTTKCANHAKAYPTTGKIKKKYQRPVA